MLPSSRSTFNTYRTHGNWATHTRRMWDPKDSMCMSAKLDMAAERERQQSGHFIWLLLLPSKVNEWE